jgi:crossover junction endodeoxyribonuclease RuvC
MTSQPIRHPVRILGIDPGLRRTGWGVIEIEGNRLAFVGCGSVEPPEGLPLASRLLAIHEGLAAVLGDFKPAEAAVEQTFVNKDGVATLKLGQARGVAMLAPAMFGISVAEYAPNQVKKTVVGAGPRRQEPGSGDAENFAAEGRAEIARRRGRAGDRHYACASPPERCTAVEGGGGMIDAGARGTPAPNPSERASLVSTPQGGGEFERRASLLPPPLRGRVGKGGPQRRSPLGAPPTPKSELRSSRPRKREGSLRTVGPHP